MIKSNKETFIKALELTATAHRADFEIVDETYATIGADSVPVISDIKSICESFFGYSNMMHFGPGCTIVDLNYESKFLKEVDEMKLMFALPFGWIDKLRNYESKD